MPMHVTPVDSARQANFAAEISGLDLSTPLDAAMLAQLWSTIDHHAVVVFRDQHLEDAQLRDFAIRFGPLEVGRMAARGGLRRLAIPQIGDISNLDVDGKVHALADRKRQDSLGNRLWHTDASYMPVPVVLGLLHAVTLPAPSALGAGETEFADLRAAWDALPAGTQELIDDLIAMHDIFHSRAQIGVTEFPLGEREQYPASPQRLVRRHPGSGRKALYLSAHASHIQDWPVADGRLLLSDLSEHATQREFVYRHEWRVGDVVIWDNRCTMHRGRPHDESQPRDLRRATTLDQGSTIDEVA
ncbi:MAG: alpha-ketoglutarate-dependent 2,4-dichlorophenoxyacetate dioxygenase [Gammaproteobacteria bacterium]|jgi:alpha-ketoglutarate-dependent 2,4-dichlorophenoxyacetate dioxygenase